MTKFNYIYFKKDKKLRILNSKLNSKLTVVFLHGLKSDMEGKKPLFLNRYCKKNKVNFLSLEYAGHGKSYLQGRYQRIRPKKHLECAIITPLNTVYWYRKETPVEL